MKQAQKQMIAIWLKEGRMAKGYTQKELSELSNISIRSIQRIENGDILPRTYTVKTLAAILDKPFENIPKVLQSPVPVEINATKRREGVRPVLSINKRQRIILSVGICLVVSLLSWAFIAQSTRFPETTFELLLFISAVVFFTIGILFLLWRDR